MPKGPHTIDGTISGGTPAAVGRFLDSVYAARPRPAPTPELVACQCGQVSEAGLRRCPRCGVARP
jgi:hypothetical protein